MTRQVGIHVENNFVRGLITEATGLNFPENACTETFNCIFTQTGEVLRRFGIDVEGQSNPLNHSRTSSVINTFRWNNVAGEGARTFIVLQIGVKLYFFQLGIAASVSGGLHGTSVDLSTFQAPGSPNPGTVECQFTSGNGLLFVTHPYCEAFRVSYTPSTNTITATQINLEIRDLEGVDDGLAVDQRPTATVGTLSPTHHYNLLNQGWTSANLTAWDTAQTTMPSNADVPWYFKNATEQFDFSSSIINNINVGNTPAPKGKFVLNLYDQDRNSVSGVSGVPGFSTGFQRCATCTFFAGRVFYSGLSVEEYNSRIFFTQIIERPDQYGKCYQQNDPTSELSFDLLPSDGGVIKILDAGRIIKMVPVFGQLIVFASNGIWAISGSEGLGFSAVDYTISKVSATRVLSHTNFVDVDGIPVWWSADGIYTLKFQAAAATPTVASLTDESIKSFYDLIPVESKSSAKGAYNPVTKVIQWVYRETTPNNIIERYNFNRMLNLNTLTGAFYPWSVDTSSASTRINSIVTVEEFGGNLIEFNVVSDGNNVVSNTTDNVIVIKSETPSAQPLFYYIVSTPDGLGNYDIQFAGESSGEYADFGSLEPEPVDYESYFVTGYKIRGDAQRKFQTNQIYIYTANDVNNAYIFQSIYDYATDGSSGRWSTTNSVNVPQGPYTIVKRKLKVRGHGIAVQYKIKSVSGEPFKIIGWSALDSANQLP